MSVSGKTGSNKSEFKWDLCTKAYRPDVKQLRHYESRNIDTSLRSLLTIIRACSPDFFSSPLFLSPPSVTCHHDVLHLLGDHPLEAQVTQRLVAHSGAFPPLFSAPPPHHIYRKTPSASRKTFDPRRHAPLTAIPVR